MDKKVKAVGEKGGGRLVSPCTNVYNTAVERGWVFRYFLVRSFGSWIPVC